MISKLWRSQGAPEREAGEGQASPSQGVSEREVGEGQASPGQGERIPGEAGSGLPFRARLFLASAGALGFAVFAVLWSSANESPGSRMQKIPGMDATPGGEVQASSERYRETLMLANDERAKRAEQVGASWISSPEGVPAAIEAPPAPSSPPGAALDLGFPAAGDSSGAGRGPESGSAPVGGQGPNPAAAAPGAGSGDSPGPQSANPPASAIVSGGAFAQGPSLPPPAAAPAPERTPNSPIMTASGATSGQNPSGGEASPEPASGTRRPAAAQPSRPSRFTQSMAQQMGAMTRAWDPPKSGGELALIKDPVHGPGTGGAKPPAGDGMRPPSETPPAPGKPPAQGGGEVLVRAGEALFAHTLNTVDSDSRTPIVAEIAAGKLKGARLIGDFTHDSGSSGLAVKFRRMSLPDGSVFDISAFAVDAATSESLVASKVESRWLSRYGPVLAASFIAGYSDSLSQTSRHAFFSGDRVVVSEPGPTSRQALHSGISSMSKAIADDILSSRARGPRIILQEGSPIGALFMESVSPSR